MQDASISRRSFIAGTFALVAGLGLSACATGRASQSSAIPSDAASGSGAASGDTSSTAAASGASGSHKVLVAYYSAQGHTRSVAERVAQDLGADIFEIVPQNPYSDDDLNWTNDSSRVTREYRDESLRDAPLVNATPDGWDGYDTVLMGYPIWWMDYAWAAAHFASDNNFTGKTVIPFCTSMSSGIGSSGRNLAVLAGTGSWQDGQRFGENASESDIDSWANGLGL